MLTLTQPITVTVFFCRVPAVTDKVMAALTRGSTADKCELLRRPSIGGEDILCTGEAWRVEGVRGFVMGYTGALLGDWFNDLHAVTADGGAK